MVNEKITYFTIADDRFFLGAVGLLNSLRLTGNEGELVLLDRGLTETQRLLLRDHATLVDVQALDLHPFLLKSFIHELKPTGIVFWIDSDIIITRSLDNLAALAEQGKICLFRNWVADRYLDEWHAAFGLRAPLRRQPYLSAGLIVFSMAHWSSFLERWAEICRLIPGADVLGGGVENPFYESDQDAINAILMSEIPAAAVAALPFEQSPTTSLLHRVQVMDEKSLSCTFRGERTSALHYVGALKPWKASAWRNVKQDAYVRLLARALFSGDVSVHPPAECAPPWLRPDRRGRLMLRALSAMHHPRARLVDVARAVVHRLPSKLREPILMARARRIHGRGR